MMLSVTTLSLYLYCPRKLFLEKVLKLVEPPKQSLVLGSIRHDIFDSINKSEQLLVSSIKEYLALEKIHENYKKKYSNIAKEEILKKTSELREFELKPTDVFRQIWPGIMNEAQIRSHNTFSFMDRNQVFGEQLWELITPKILSELSVSSTALGLKGIVDRIEVHGDLYIPLELKTGSLPRTGMWPGHRIQIAAYMLLLQETLNKTIQEGFVH